MDLRKDSQKRMPLVSEEIIEKIDNIIEEPPKPEKPLRSRKTQPMEYKTIEVDTEIIGQNPYLTPFEKAKVLASRAQMISMDKPIFVNPGKLTDPLEIAKLELKMRKIPIELKRRLPDGRIYIVKVSELLYDIK